MTSNAIPTSTLPLRIEEITADWLTRVLSEGYPGTVVTGLHIGTVIAGTATKVRLLLSYNEAGHRHRLPPTMWLKGGFIRHEYSFDESFVNEAKFFATWAPEMNINIPKSFWTGWEEAVQGLVLMEDLAARNARFGRATELITLDQQAQTLELLARMHARWWESPELKSLRNFSTVWQANDRVVMMMLEPEYFDSCMTKRRCAAYVGPYRDRERIKQGLVGGLITAAAETLQPVHIAAQLAQTQRVLHIDPEVAAAFREIYDVERRDDDCGHGPPHTGACSNSLPASS